MLAQFHADRPLPGRPGPDHPPGLPCWTAAAPGLQVIDMAQAQLGRAKWLINAYCMGGLLSRRPTSPTSPCPPWRSAPPTAPIP